MKKFKILLICSSGMSTSLLVTKMKNYTNEVKKDYEINALSAEASKSVLDNYDVLLLSPGIAFQKKSFEMLKPKPPIEVIPPQLYGLIDGKGTVELAEKLGNINNGK